MSGESIDSVLNELRVFPPHRDFIAKARVNGERLAALRQAADQDHAGFWSRLAHTELAWQKPFSVALDDSAAPNYR